MVLMMVCCISWMNIANVSNVEEGEEKDEEDAKEAGAVVDDEPVCGLRSRCVPLSAEEEEGEEGAGEARKA